MDSIELWAGFFDVIGLGFLLLKKHQKPYPKIKLCLFTYEIHSENLYFLREISIDSQ